MKRGIFCVFLLLLTVTLLLGLAGCGHRDYEIHEVDGRFYVKFDTEWEPWENPAGREPSVTFPSLAAMQFAFLRGWLSDDETVSYRFQLEETEYGYPICDLHNLYEPVLPENALLKPGVMLRNGVDYTLEFRWGPPDYSPIHQGNISFWSPERLEREAAGFMDYGKALLSKEGWACEEVSYRNLPAEYFRLTAAGKVQAEVYQYMLTEGEDTLYIREIFRYKGEDRRRYLDSLRIMRIRPTGGSFDAVLNSESLSDSYKYLSDVSLEWITGFSAKKFREKPKFGLSPEDLEEYFYITLLSEPDFLSENFNSKGSSQEGSSSEGSSDS